MRRGRTAVGGCGGRARPGSGGPPAIRPAAWIAAMLVLASLVTSRPALAAPPPAEGGALLLATGDGPAQPAPILEIDVALRVTGLVARGTVMQRFRNPTGRWLEGVYLFPLPEKAAVDGLRMRVGDRVIEGEIREREEAKRTFEAARKAGKRASLVEQHRPDVFTAKVANVAPGAEITIEIDFQQTLAFDEQGFALRLPWIVAPRYEPGRLEATPVMGDFPAPVALQAGPGPRPDVALAIDLDPGFPLVEIESPTHAIDLEQLGLRRLLVTLAEGHSIDVTTGL